MSVRLSTRVLDQASAVPSASVDQLASQLRQYSNWFVLTGAGVSTGSGIPDYRDREGQWKRRQPIMHQAFIAERAVQQRYWARSLIGWRFFGHAAPSSAHHRLAELEDAGCVSHIVTQNVDGLHQRAGSLNVIDLHGRIGLVKCLACGEKSDRDTFQSELERLNPDYVTLTADIAPDGDADLDGIDFSGFEIPACASCGGTLMPDVVFYGDAVPKPTVEAAKNALECSDAVLVVGSSLMVYSGYRFCVQAQALGLPIFAINHGRTRADAMLQLKVDMDCGEALGQVTKYLIN